MIENIITQSQVLTQSITTYFVTPLLIIFIGLAIAALLKNSVRTALSAVQLDMRLGKNVPVSLESTMSNIAFVGIALASVAIALARLNILDFVIGRVLFFLLWLGALAGLLAGTDGIRNVWVKKQAEKLYPVGYTYSNNGLSGVVKKHTFTHLVVFTTQTERVHVPYLTAVREAR